VWRGVLAIGIGAISVIWPDITVGAFVILFAMYAFIAAAMDATRAFSSNGAGGVVGHLLLSVAFAAALFIRPDLGALSLATVFGLYSIFYGISTIVVGREGRQLQHTTRRVTEAVS
jgi:uncharacterized membrane protein HdeD (DUF308 family)